VFGDRAGEKASSRPSSFLRSSCAYETECDAEALAITEKRLR
jgi:hypothetical protein